VAGSVRSSASSACFAGAASQPVVTGPWQAAPQVEGLDQETL
jgi:hypothetical protein